MTQTIADKLEALLPERGAETKQDRIIMNAATQVRELEARIDRMGEAKPYKLIAITAALAFVAGAVLL